MLLVKQTLTIMVCSLLAVKIHDHKFFIIPNIYHQNINENKFTEWQKKKKLIFR